MARIAGTAGPRAGRERGRRFPAGRGSPWLGSVLAKSFRDELGAIAAVGGLLLLMVVAGGVVMATTYGSVATRRELALLSTGIPDVMRGLYGNPVGVDRLGGFIAWHYGTYIAMIGGLWSLLTCSRTVAGEAARGSLDLVLAAPRSRRRVAWEKVAAHLAALGIVAAATGVATWVVGLVFAILPGDAIAPAAAAGFAAGIWARAAIAGAVAFAVAPVLGRGAGAGIAGAALLGGYLVHGYRSVVDGFDLLAPFTWWAWTDGHLPLVGITAWDGVAVTALVTALLLVAGVEAVVRRDVGVTIRVPSPTLPVPLLGLRGPVGRSVAEVLPGAAWWGLGVAAFGYVMAAVADGFVEILAASPQLSATFRLLVPQVDITTHAGFLELAFVDFGYLLAGLAVATFAGARWGDESARRLELVLATPVARSRWVAGTWVATLAGLGIVVAAFAASIGAGLVAGGADPGAAVAGAAAILAHGAAVAGIATAIGGLLGPRRVAAGAGAVVIGTFLVDVLAPVLRLPDWVADLALSEQLGRPLAGEWGAPGLAASAVLAVGGLLAGTAAFRRRDIGA